ncbi:hypothetical protein PR048_012993 [Dryococelus australis]|uniref:Uncharacterized protein n=1 Tax=Dryococelus australis TaxID=614101 RepID=A0ABQ9HR23_9NEOP|nr:hypothetical protein PR048_012993 [Dryococelus australis]
MENKHLPENQLYLRAKIITKMINENVRKPPDYKETSSKIFSRCTNFLTEGCLQIQKRYNFNNPVNLLLSESTMCKSVPSLIHNVQEEKQLDKFWAKISTLEDKEGKHLFKNVSSFVLSVHSVPHSNADRGHLQPLKNDILLARQSVGNDSVNLSQVLECTVKCLFRPIIPILLATREFPMKVLMKMK